MALASIMFKCQELLFRFFAAMYGTLQIPLPPYRAQTAIYLKVLNISAPEDPPPPYGDGSSVKLWQVRFTFGSDADVLQGKTPSNSTVDWTAVLKICTCDLPGIMQHGLYLTPENVQERDNYLDMTYLPTYRAWIYARSYTVFDSNWSGRLRVFGWDTKPLADFRIRHLSASKVITAIVGDKKQNLVYCYDRIKPGHRFNVIYDDAPMDGLWPWPRREQEDVENEEKKAN